MNYVLFFIISANSSSLDYYLSPKTNTSVIITSPGYPLGYTPNLNISWTIHTEPHYHIEIEFLAVDFVPTRTLYERFYYNRDYVIVETGKYALIMYRKLL